MSGKQIWILMAMLFVSLLAPWAAAVPMPVAWDFGTDPGKDDTTGFSLSGGSSRWNLQANSLEGKGGTSNTNEGATIQIDNLGTIFTEFEIATELSRPNVQFFDRFGILALGTGSGAINANSIAAVIGNNENSNQGNDVRLQLRSGGVAGTVLSEVAWAGASGGVFSLLLQGEQDGPGNWDLMFTVTDANGHFQTISTDDFASNGQWVGMGLRGRDIRPAQFFNFSVTEPVAEPVPPVVPEPATLALAASGLLVLVRRRRQA